MSKSDIKTKMLDAKIFHTVDGERINNLASDYLTGSELLQVKSAIKALNQRMSEYERHDMTDLAGYKNLENWVKSMNNSHTKDDGFIRAKQSTKGLTVAQARRTMAILNNNMASYKTETAYYGTLARESGEDLQYTKTGRLANTQHNRNIIRETGSGYSSLHEFIHENASAIYALNNASEETKELYEITTDMEAGLHRKGSLTVQETVDILNAKTAFERGELDEILNSWIADPKNTP